jgi:hypothetical protein
MMNSGLFAQADCPRLWIYPECVSQPDCEKRDRICPLKGAAMAQKRVVLSPAEIPEAAEHEKRNSSACCLIPVKLELDDYAGASPESKA